MRPHVSRDGARRPLRASDRRRDRSNGRRPAPVPPRRGARSRGRRSHSARTVAPRSAAARPPERHAPAGARVARTQRRRRRSRFPTRGGAKSGGGAVPMRTALAPGGIGMVRDAARRSGELGKGEPGQRRRRGGARRSTTGGLRSAGTRWAVTGCHLWLASKTCHCGCPSLTVTGVANVQTRRNRRLVRREFFLFGSLGGAWRGSTPRLWVSCSTAMQFEAWASTTPDCSTSARRAMEGPSGVVGGASHLPTGC